MKTSLISLAVLAVVGLVAVSASPSIVHPHAPQTVDVQVEHIDVQHPPVSEVPLLYDLMASEGLHLQRAAIGADPKAQPLKVQFILKDAKSSPAVAESSFDTLSRTGQIVPAGEADPKTGRGYQVAFAIAGEAKGNQIPVIVEYAISQGNVDGHAGAGGVVHGTLKTTVQRGSSNVIAADGDTILTLSVG